MSKYTFKTKMKAVNFYLTKCYSYKETASLFGVNTLDIIQWGSGAKKFNIFASNFLNLDILSI